MKSKSNSINDPYELNHRIQRPDGSFGQWNKAKGEWFGITHVFGQVKRLKQAYLKHRMQFEIKYQGMYLDLKGNEIDGWFEL